ncbi:MAG: hypothetical protein ACOCX1_04130 [Fimbriimonadaceae bacterium]
MNILPIRFSIVLFGLLPFVAVGNTVQNTTASNFLLEFAEAVDRPVLIDSAWLRPPADISATQLADMSLPVIGAVFGRSAQEVDGRLIFSRQVEEQDLRLLPMQALGSEIARAILSQEPTEGEMIRLPIEEWPADIREEVTVLLASTSLGQNLLRNPAGLEIQLQVVPEYLHPDPANPERMVTHQIVGDWIFNTVPNEPAEPLERSIFSRQSELPMPTGPEDFDFGDGQEMPLYQLINRVFEARTVRFDGRIGSQEIFISGAWSRGALEEGLKDIYEPIPWVQTKPIDEAEISERVQAWLANNLTEPLNEGTLTLGDFLRGGKASRDVLRGSVPRNRGNMLDQAPNEVTLGASLLFRVVGPGATDGNVLRQVAYFIPLNPR